MSNNFDAYDDNDEITLSSSNNNKEELKRENTKLKKEIEEATIKITEYEEVISNSNVKDIKNSSLSEDDIFNIMHNSSYIIVL